MFLGLTLCLAAYCPCWLLIWLDNWFALVPTISPRHQNKRSYQTPVYDTFFWDNKILIVFWWFFFFVFFLCDGKWPTISLFENFSLVFLRPVHCFAFKRLPVDLISIVRMIKTIATFRAFLTNEKKTQLYYMNVGVHDNPPFYIT